MSVKTSPRRQAARRRQAIVTNLREQRAYADRGALDALDLRIATAKTVDLLLGA